MKAKTNQIETTVSASPLESIETTQASFETWWIIVFLVVVTSSFAILNQPDRVKDKLFKLASL